ncbi:MAG: hypothetical protein Q4D60_11460 [Eubacteriales bacterium]|nr:hypothetical protein [Eubacteriales bacterium]
MKLYTKRLAVCLMAGMITFNSPAFSMLAAAETTTEETTAEESSTEDSVAPETDSTEKNKSATRKVEDGKYFVDDEFQSDFTGWEKINNKIYYFKKGVALTGWNYLKSYSGGKKKYKYFFKPNGQLVTNLFNYKNNYKTYIQKPMTIEVNLTTHNITFYLYDNKKKSYCIPAKTVICSTSRYKNGTKIRAGKKGRLEKTSARKWFIYKKANPWRYYQYGVHIKNSKAWFHSTLYRTSNPKKLMDPNHYNGYNYLGTDQTTNCIRMQAVNAKLIYDIATKTNKKARVWVNIYRSKDEGPFGKVTLDDTTGKLPSKTNIDPTDPKYTKKKY